MGERKPGGAVPLPDLLAGLLGGLLLLPASIAGADEDTATSASGIPGPSAAPPPGDLPPPAPPGPFGLEGSLLDRFLLLTENEVAFDAARPVRAGASVRDAFADWEIQDGRVAPVRTRSGIVIGAYFQGNCVFSYTPPPGQEAASLQRITTRWKLERVPCTEGYLLTEDEGVLGDLGVLGDGGQAAGAGKPATATARATATPATMEPSGWLKELRKEAEIVKLDGHFHDTFAFATLRRALGASEPWTRDVRPATLVLRIEGIGRPPFADERTLPPDTLSWSVSDSGREAHHEPASLALSHRGDDEDEWRLLVNSHPLHGSPEEPAPDGNLDLLSADLDLDITTSLNPFAELQATATLRLTTGSAPAAAVDLALARLYRYEGIHETLGFHVESVTDWKGRRLDYLHHAGQLLVQLRSPLAPGQEEKLTVGYRGNAMPQLTTDSFGLLANYAWWPQPLSEDRYTWASTICVPLALRAVGTGAVTREWADKGQRCERWEEPVSVGFAAINLGRWEHDETVGPHGVRIRAFFLGEDRNQIDPVLKAARAILPFYEGIFGKYPYAELDIAEALPNMGFWQAPAGLVELSKSEYMTAKTAEKDQRKDFYPEVSTATLAHEIAHQWWGHVVGWRSYRDQWVSETFAEYASFLFMAQFQGKDSYTGRLEFWEHGVREADERFHDRGPMTLGARLGPTRVAQFYRRGPYALHMLRRLAGDKAFTEFLRTLATVAPNSNLSTAEVQLVAERVLGPEVNAFFEQWIHGSTLPDLLLTWRDLGKEVELTLEQTQFWDPIRLAVPVVLRGAKGKPARHVLVTDARSLTVSVPAPASGLRRVELDPERELLTRSKKVREAEGAPEEAPAGQ
jgi:hypothetical protein